jgi:hypothetical protein
MANAMPLYLTSPIGVKFWEGSVAGVNLNQNENYSLAEQIDINDLGNYLNYIIRWTDKSGESFSDSNYHKLDGACTAIIPVKGFYNSQYAPTALIFTENSITRLVIDDVTNQKAGANPMVGEQSGYGCSSIKFIAKYGNIVFWYSDAKNHCYMYDGENIKNISINKIEFTSPTMIFINNAERQLIVVDDDKQYIYSLENNEWYSATGLDIIASTTINDGKSLIVRANEAQYPLYEYPSEADTLKGTKLVTKSYNTGGLLVDRVKADFTGDDVDSAVDIEYGGYHETIENEGIATLTSCGITYRAQFLFFTLTGIDGFTSLSVDIRRY